MVGSSNFHRSEVVTSMHRKYPLAIVASGDLPVSQVETSDYRNPVLPIIPPKTRGITIYPSR